MEADQDLQNLVERAKSGDRASFDGLIHRCRPQLEAYVRSRLGEELGGRVEIQDVVQESFLRAFRSISEFQFRDGDSLINWLCGIAKHVIWEAASQLRRDRPVRLDFEVDAEGTSPSRAVRRDERFDRLQRALDSLSPEYREVILLVRVDGLPVRDVAKKLNRTPHAVSNLLLRATRKLKEILADTESLSLPNRRLKRNGDQRDA